MRILIAMVRKTAKIPWVNRKHRSSKSLRKDSGIEWSAGATKRIMTLLKRYLNLVLTTIWLERLVRTGIWHGGTDLRQYSCSQRCIRGNALIIFLVFLTWQGKICWDVIWCEWGKSFLKTTTFSRLHLCSRMTTKSSCKLLGKNGTKLSFANLKITAKVKEFSWLALPNSCKNQPMLILNKAIKATMSTWWFKDIWQNPIWLMASSLT